MLAKGISASDRIELKMLIRQLAPEAHTVLFFSSAEPPWAAPSGTVRNVHRSVESRNPS